MLIKTAEKSEKYFQ